MFRNKDYYENNLIDMVAAVLVQNTRAATAC